MTTDANRRVALRVLAVSAAMLGLGFAAAPAYDLFCRVTGFGGTPLRADSVTVEAVEQEIRVRFDANVARDMPWAFTPAQKEMRVKLGEQNIAYYRAHNPTDRPITGTASFNVAPFNMGGFFVKIDCFCFEEQTLQPGESIDMPVVFFVDPAMLEDDEAQDTRVVTLSYMFFETEPSAAEAAAGPDEG